MSNLSITVIATMIGLHWFGWIGAGIAFVTSAFFIVVDSDGKNLRLCVNNLAAIWQRLDRLPEKETSK